jgi:phosphopantothenoylcysteine decarboxylase/phosphopantothenate--cysteine ligase
MSSLLDRRILLGITGGIAAYKSIELVRRLKEMGTDVQVVMTPAAAAFVTPLTLQAVSGRSVRLELLDANAEAGMGHIELARWAELIVIAPASADFIARMAHGLANDLLSTLCLASDRPIAVAPAMNRLMWLNPATQTNGETLRQRGVLLWGPASGEQACGEVGEGRMLEPLQLRELITAFFTRSGLLAGLRVLITAGPTREALDPVRFISNRSSGRMGFAIANAAAAAGAQVTLISGPVALPSPVGVERIDVESAGQMHETVMQRVAGTDIFIATAAVADYHPVTVAAQKIKKTQQTLTVTLARNPDILAAVAAQKQGPFTVGFAAETEHVLEYAHDKRRRKKLDMIAANQVGVPGRGFESRQNALHVLWEGGERVLALADKTQLGHELVALIAQRYHAQQ